MLGLETLSKGASSLPGRSAYPVPARTLPASATPSAGRQRLDGSRPFGNSSNEAPSRPKQGVKVKF